MWLHKLVYQANRLRLFCTRPLTVGVRLLPIKGGKVVLVRHTYQDHWYLPGGGIKKGESLEQAVRREAKEEIGAELKTLQLFGVYTNFYEYKSDHIAVFLTHEFSLNDADDSEIAAVESFGLEALPGDISPGSKRRIEQYAAGEYPCHGIW